MKLSHTRKLLTVLLSVGLMACAPKGEADPALTKPSVQAQAAAKAEPSRTDAVEAAHDFEAIADRDNAALAPSLYEDKPFADDTMPADLPAVADGLKLVETCPPGTPPAINFSAAPFPIHVCQTSEQGYPIYTLKCNLKTRECINTIDRHHVGTTDVVGPQLTYVRNEDVLREEFICDNLICIDGQGRVVGQPQPTMVAWMTSQNTNTDPPQM